MVPLRSDTPRRRPADGRRLGRWAAVLPVALALLLWAFAPWLVERLPTSDPRARAEAGVDRGRRALLDAWADVDRTARALAADPLVQRAALGDPPDALGDLVERFATSAPAPHTGIEVWRDSVLLGWQGRADTGPTAPADGLVDSGQRLHLRRTLALPNVAGGRVVVTRTVRQIPPVRNAFLRPYDLVGEATRTLDLTVRLDTVHLETARGAPARVAPGGDSGEGRTVAVPVTVTLDDGRRVSLGSLHVDVPRPVAPSRRAGDVRAFWAAVAVLALAFAVGRQWRQALRRRHGPVARWTLALVGALGLVRAVLLAVDVPGRWERGATPLAPLFDPERFATPVGAGLARSLGDLILTIAVGLGMSWVASRGLALACARTDAPTRLARTRHLATIGAAVLAGAATLVATDALAVLARRALLDSTLAVFSRAALWPGRDVALLLAALLGATLALVWTSRALAAGARLVACRSGLPGRLHTPFLTLGGMVGGALAAFALRPAPEAIAGAALGLAVGVWPGRERRLWPGSLRALLPAVLLVATLLYALLAGGLAAQRQMQMDDAAGSVERDARVLFDLTDVLQRAREDSLLRQTLLAPPDSARRARLDAAAANLVRDALLGSYGPFDIGLVVFDRNGRIAGRYAEGLSAPSDVLDADEFGLLRAMQTERDSSVRAGGGDGDPDLLVEPVTGRREADRFQYLGLARLDSAGFITARAEPAPRTRDFETPFPRVLLPDGAAGLASDLAVAQFRDGAFVRGIGQDFGRVRLGDDVAQALATVPELWRTETDRTGRYRVLYRRQTDDASGTSLPDPTRVVAVRAPMLTVFDHLYYALRLALIGLALSLVPVAIALARHRGSWRPRHFRDRVLGAFLAVGGTAVVAVALVGRSVVVGEQARSTDAWLAQSLERVEETLTLDAPAGALAYRQLERTSIDSLARRLDLDLNVYRGPTLVATSRPVLLRDGLLDSRLPAAAYEVLGFQGQRFVALDARLGSFRYRAGYRALLDESGRPVYVLSVPTLPEQERMEAEQARMQAYLFGALLVLLVLLLATATLLARALARPIARLREGLRTVAGGRFDTPLPVDRDDEMGELARTFNAMQAQLAESRRQLTQQERQLAWREMARQVAHEIKNPLTPMKLSVQHLRRAYDDTVEGEVEVPSRFARMFDRVTTTLLEQIDALTRIASDFSTFARLPRRVAEPLDLSRVAAEAADLMQTEDAGAEVTLSLAAEPLVVSADREEMRRVFINLVKNAIQATEGRDVRRVTVTSRADGGEAVVDVADTGTGISDDDRERIFVPNFSTKTSGTGLGLAIARQAIEASGGTIAFETTEGAGSTFTVRLPLLAPDAP